MTQFLHHYITRHHWHYTEMNELYASLSLRALALGIGGVFVPLYLYDIGYGLAMIAVFYMVSMALRMPLEVGAAYLISWIGVKHTLTLSYLSLIAHFVSLYFLSSFPWLWVFAALFLACEMSLFWVSYHLHASSSRSSKRGSSQVSIAIILMRSFMALGPLLGGVVATRYGVEHTLLLAAFLLASAAYPLSKTPDIRRTLTVQWKRLEIDFKRQDSIAHTAWQISGVAATYLWPLWLLLILGEYDEIGFLIALSIVLGIGLTFWVGKLGDQGYNGRFLRLGSYIKVLSHGLRTISHDFGVALVANVTNDLGDNFAAGPFTEKFYKAADQGGRMEYILQMNVIGVVVKWACWVVLLALALFLTEMLALQTMFVLAALAVPAIVWVSRRKIE